MTWDIVFLLSNCERIVLLIVVESRYCNKGIAVEPPAFSITVVCDANKIGNTKSKPFWISNVSIWVRIEERAW